MDEESIDIYDDSLKFGNEEPTTKNMEDFSLYDDLDNSQTQLNQPLIASTLPPQEELEDLEETTDIEKFPSDQATLLIANLTWYTSDQDLEELFSPFGKIKDIKFFEDKRNGKSKGAATIEFYNAESASSSMEKLNGSEIHGKICELSFASPEIIRTLRRANAQRVMRKESIRGGGAMGGFGGRGRGRSMMQRNRMMGIPANNAAMAGMSPQSSSFDFMPGMVPIGRMRGGRGHPSAFNAMSPMGMMSMVHDSRFFSPMAMRGPPPSTMNPIFFQGHEDPMLPPQSSSTNAAPYGGGGGRCSHTERTSFSI